MQKNEVFNLKLSNHGKNYMEQLIEKENKLNEKFKRSLQVI